ncbi:MAG: hypothetical protein R3C68_19775 [Myxococcota bacterium]
MPRQPIDWKSVEPSLHKLKKDALFGLLHESFHALSAARRTSIFGEYVDRPDLRDASAHDISMAVEKFHSDSVGHRYYDSFDVNSKNYRDKSEGTVLWISECNRLFEQCVILTKKGHHTEARQSMDLLFDLLDQMDRDSGQIIFLADEAGSWQVGVDFDCVLPAYLTSLAAHADPKDYAQRAVTLIAEYASYDREKFLAVAQDVANPQQCQALSGRAISKQADKGRPRRGQREL